MARCPLWECHSETAYIVEIMVWVCTEGHAWTREQVYTDDVEEPWQTWDVIHTSV